MHVNYVLQIANLAQVEKLLAHTVIHLTVSTSTEHASYLAQLIMFQSVEHAHNAMMLTAIHANPIYQHAMYAMDKHYF
jgi:hypothetical protein